MKNKPGSPVEGDDFFNRPKDLARLQREIENGNHILLTAPRRVGKTSLVLRLTENFRRTAWAAAYLNVEGCDDEISFAKKLVDALRNESIHTEFLTGLGLLLKKFRRATGGVKIGVGVNLELGDSADADHSTLGRALESIFRRIEKEEQRDVLIAIDEMPELLLAMAKHEHGVDRVAQFLHWLRALRQTYRKRIHWIFLGSIGLDSFVGDRNLGKTINDLVSLGLDALTPAEADRFLEILGNDNNLSLSAETRHAIVSRVGWPLPHHLQLVFHALVDIGTTTADPVSVEAAIAHLLRPENLGQFDTWRQRLEEQFGSADAETAKLILKHLCQHAKGRKRTQLMNALMSARPHGDPDVTEGQLSKLLQVLLRDGYLIESDRNYAFRSFLLREYWSRREIR